AAAGPRNRASRGRQPAGYGRSVGSSRRNPCRGTRRSRRKLRPRAPGGRPAGPRLSHVESRKGTSASCDSSQETFRAAALARSLAVMGWRRKGRRRLAAPRSRLAEGQGVTHESPERRKGTPEDPGAGLGTDVSRAGRPVRNRLHVPEGAEEGPAQAGAALVLPDAGGEGPPRLRRPGRRHPREHVPAGTRALAGGAEAVPVHSP